jgi:hypothetical protein
MVRSVVLLSVFWAVSTANGQTSCNASPSQPPVAGKLNLRVYDSANVPRKTLDRAVEVAQHILSNAGVPTRWDRGAANPDEVLFTDLTGSTPSKQLQADDRNYLAARIIRGEPEDRFPGALGYALPFAQAGPHAFVYYDRIERLLPSVPSSVTKILGHALAHELGHALLETMEHSAIGLMKGRWSKADFQHTAAGLLEFSPDQAQVLQQRARSRADTAEIGPSKHDRCNGLRPMKQLPSRSTDNAAVPRRATRVSPGRSR